MEDFNNNDDYVVPDFMTPDLFVFENTSSQDEQFVPATDLELESQAGIPQMEDIWPINEVIPNDSQPDVGTSHRWHNFMPINLPIGTQDHESSFAAPSTSASGEYRSNVHEEAISHPNLVPVTPPENPAPQILCPVCSRPFKHKLSLTNHLRAHIVQQRHLCTICGETFKYKANFKRHRREHAKEMKICRYCGVNMDSDYDLVQHEKEHRRQQNKPQDDTK